jgi:adenosylcobyric acid synthase
MAAKTIMVLGSMSSAGKSLLVTGLCRLYARRGVRVAPFKAQNMSNNAAVCAGGEIGRAQAAQAHAAGIEPTVEMNPILLKPEGDARSQVIVRGQIWDSISAGDYYARRAGLWQVVTECIDRLRDQYELVILEGAGSPAELNLRRNDLVNLAAARYAGAPCLLVGDIDRGGVFAQLLGTAWLLDEADRDLIRGFVINKFRGDRALFDDGIQILEERSGIPVLGVVPYLKDHGIADEDAALLDERSTLKAGALDVAVIQLPHISNFDDLDPLAAETQVGLRFVRRPNQLGSPAAVILPGTKNTLEDLHWLHQSGLAQAIWQLAASGCAVVGLCGGFQMLGEEVSDAGAVESGWQRLPGVGLLPVVTRFESQKTVTRSQARILAGNGFLAGLKGSLINGYEIHMGQTRSNAPLAEVVRREALPVSAPDGACSVDGRVWGSYLHGIFDNDAFRAAWLHSLGAAADALPFAARRASAYDHLADVLETALNIPLLDQIIEKGL